MAPAGAKGLNGWLRVSMYQIASVELAGEVDLRDLRAALAAEAPLGALVALAVERVRGGVRSRLPSAPSAGTLGPCLEIGPRRSISPDWLTLGHRPV